MFVMPQFFNLSDRIVCDIFFFKYFPSVTLIFMDAVFPDKRPVRLPCYSEVALFCLSVVFVCIQRAVSQALLFITKRLSLCEALHGKCLLNSDISCVSTVFLQISNPKLTRENTATLNNYLSSGLCIHLDCFAENW